MPTSPSMPIGNTGAPSSEYGSLVTPEQMRRLDLLPNLQPGENMDPLGGRMNDTRYTLSRSPGCFSVKVVEGGEAIVIGEDWMGPGESAANGGLQGCAGTSPGLCFRGDGTCFLVGGSTRITASDILASAGTDGTTLIAALIKPYSAQGEITFTALNIPSSVSADIGHWFDIKQGLSSAYLQHHIVPIAMLELTSAPEVSDVYWTMESPVIGVPAIETHPWKMWVYENSGVTTFDVAGGYVSDGYDNTLVSDLGATVLAVSELWVWLRVKHYNDTGTPSEAQIVYGVAGFPSSSVSYDTVPSGTTMPTESGYCETILPIAYYSSATGITQYLDDAVVVPWGKSYIITRTIYPYWDGTLFKNLMSTEYYRNGIMVNCSVSVSTLFDVDDCPSTP